MKNPPAPQVILMELEDIFSSRCQTRLIQYFLEHPKEVFNLNMITKETGMAYSTIYQVVQPLVRMKIVTKTEVSKNINLFSLNESDPKVKVISAFYHRVKTF